MNEAVSTLESKLNNYSEMQTLLDQFKGMGQQHLDTANHYKSENEILKSQNTQISEKLISLASQIDSLNNELSQEKDNRNKIEIE